MRTIVAIMLALMVAGCGDGAGGVDSSQAITIPRTETTEVLAETETRNLVEIRNLTPVSATEGEPVTFTFDVAYNLTGYQQGVINIGFNSWDADSYVFLSDKAIVDEGMGTEKFTVTVTPVRWEAPLEFKLNVSLSEYPHPSSWQPLASVSKAIDVSAATTLVQQRSASGQQPVVLPEAGTVETCYEDFNLKAVYCNQY